ncbi:hypothetical protein [Paraburkholderia xenovorans]|uniref:hypothetical protein n=1 Tax=Paraburkholderia xenovorans TaxID=36873 RepID=UPI0038B9F32C
MERLRQETTGELADRWTVLMNELNRYGSGHYPDLLCVEVLRLVRETERLALPDPFETDLIFTARTLIGKGDPKVAMFKLHEVISGRL